MWFSSEMVQNVVKCVRYLIHYTDILFNFVKCLTQPMYLWKYLLVCPNFNVAFTGVMGVVLYIPYVVVIVSDPWSIQWNTSYSIPSLLQYSFFLITIIKCIIITCIIHTQYLQHFNIIMNIFHYYFFDITKLI